MSSDNWKILAVGLFFAWVLLPMLVAAIGDIASAFNRPRGPRGGRP